MINEFITVFDEAMYDYDAGEFVGDRSSMSYEIFVGSLSEITTPGNSGQITVVKFDSSGNGKVKIRFTPAR